MCDNVSFVTEQRQFSTTYHLFTGYLIPKISLAGNNLFWFGDNNSLLIEILLINP